MPGQVYKPVSYQPKMLPQYIGTLKIHLALMIDTHNSILPYDNLKRVKRMLFQINSNIWESLRGL